MKFPAHKCGLYLTHNEHRDTYTPLDQWIADMDQYEWASDEAKARAIATDECWTLQWYPETPIGFHAAAAPTLDELLAWTAADKSQDQPTVSAECQHDIRKPHSTWTAQADSRCAVCGERWEMPADQPPAAMSAEERCRLFCAWKGGGPCLADDCPRRNVDQPEDAGK